MKTEYRFVPMGTVAPDPLPAGELWLDIGSRIGPGVLDHHHGGSAALSAAELVLRRWDDLVPEALRALPQVTMVLHADPDVDAVASAWLATRFLTHGWHLADVRLLTPLVQVISDLDQGWLRTDDPLTCWPLILRTCLNVIPRPPGGSDEYRASQLQVGFALVEETFAVLQAGGTVADAARRLASPQVRMKLSPAARDYLEDLSRTTQFQLRLPVQPIPDEPTTLTPARWSLVDGLFIEDPASELFKELARADGVHSPLQQGFGFLVVSHEHPPEVQETCRRLLAGSPDGSSATAAETFHRHLVSTDPLTGLYMPGLGAELERREQTLEQGAGGRVLPGRERLGPGQGRFGSGLAQPWYDGRGHHFTIIDSPGLAVPEAPGAAPRPQLCVSRLPPAAVLEAVWEYGDPARFIPVFEAEVYLFAEAEAELAAATAAEPGVSLTQRCPELAEALRPEVREQLDRDLRIVPSPASVPGPTNPTFALKEQTGWRFAGGPTLVARRYVLAADAKMDCRRLTEDLRRLRAEMALPGTAAAPAPRRVFHLVCIRVAEDAVSLTDAAGASALAFYRLAAGGGVRFAERPSAQDLAGFQRAVAADESTLLGASPTGALLVTVRDQEAAARHGFLAPSGAAFLAALVLAQRGAIDHLFAGFAEHRREVAVGRGGAAILGDRLGLLDLEQNLLFAQVTAETFGQQGYERLGAAVQTAQALTATKERIEALATHVREKRASFYERVSFWLSILFAPLVLATSVFSGIQMERKYGTDYFSLVPDDWPAPGLLSFGLVFVVFAALMGLIWWLLAYWHERAERR